MQEEHAIKKEDLNKLLMKKRKKFVILKIENYCIFQDSLDLAI